MAVLPLTAGQHSRTSFFVHRQWEDDAVHLHTSVAGKVEEEVVEQLVDGLRFRHFLDKVGHRVGQQRVGSQRILLCRLCIGRRLPVCTACADHAQHQHD